MASRAPVRSLRQLVQRQRRICQCTPPIRQFSRTAVSLENEEVERYPRWSRTPPAMKAPFTTRIKDPEMAWEANSDPEKVDNMYISMFGPGGQNMLTEEVKWLALTHKSFDGGRRGFNDRLAYLGKRLLLLQCQIALLQAPASPLHSTDTFQSIRTPFTHPSLEGLSTLSGVDINTIFGKERLSNLAQRYGIHTVTRWKPRNPKDMHASGCDVVYATSLYAILGAIVLEKGGKVANDVAREKILKPLGI